VGLVNATRRSIRTRGDILRNVPLGTRRLNSEVRSESNYRSQLVSQDSMDRMALLKYLGPKATAGGKVVSKTVEPGIGAQ